MSSEEWSSDANEAVQIALVRPGTNNALKTIHRFNPKFTYPIFGVEERIFGYKGLQIEMRFAAHDLRPNVRISYDRSFRAIGDTAPLDINKTLKEWLPSSAFTKAADFERLMHTDTTIKEFKPPGRLLHTYSRNDKAFEIWAGSLLDPAVREILQRMQIFISFFIEGGTPINTEDADWTIERWTIFFVYENSSVPSTPAASPYSLVGYATTYRFYAYQPRTAKSPSQTTMAVFPPAEILPISKLPSRLRISQFVILPPYQEAGHGSALYKTIYSTAMADAMVRELTVEDPSEEFDVLRDVNDWKVLEPKFREANVRINISPFASNEKYRLRRLPTSRLLPVETLKKIRSSTKISGRQFARQLEMYLLSLIPYSHRAAGGASVMKIRLDKSRTANLDDKSYYWWRLILKQRIYKKNRDILQQLDVEDRLSKVEESLRAQEDEYEKLLVYYVTSVAKDLLKNGGGGGGGGGAEGVEGVQSSSKARKRKLIVDDDDEEEDEDANPDAEDDDEGVDGLVPHKKKAKF